MAASKQTAMFVAAARVGASERWGVGDGDPHARALDHLVDDLAKERASVTADLCKRMCRIRRRGASTDHIAQLFGVLECDVARHVGGLCDCQHTEFAIGSRRGGRQ